MRSAIAGDPRTGNPRCAACRISSRLSPAVKLIKFDTFAASMSMGLREGCATLELRRVRKLFLDAKNRLTTNPNGRAPREFSRESFTSD